MYLDLSQSAKHGAQRMQHEYTPWVPYPWTGQLPEVLQCYAQEHPAYSEQSNNHNYSQLSLSPPTCQSDHFFFFFFCNMLRNKQYPVEIPPKRFHLNGHTMGFCPQIQNLDLHTKQIVPLALPKRFRLNGHTIGFVTHKLKSWNHLTKPIMFSCSKSFTLDLEVSLRKLSRKTSWTTL